MNKKRLIALLVQLVIIAVAVVLIYNSLVGQLDLSAMEYRQYVGAEDAWHVRCWSDALFIPGVLWAGFGGLMWIASTGFFDIFSYAFRSLIVLFSPLRNPREFEHFYEYKLARAEKRKGGSANFMVLGIGLVLIAAAVVLTVVHGNMVGPSEELPLEYIQTIEQTGGPDADVDMTGGD